jgi:hypothetical protein
MCNSTKMIIAIAGLLICSAEAHADRTCDNGSLLGQYASRAHGATVRVLDASNTLHAFASPLLLNAIGQFMFNGDGTFTRLDFTIADGTPQPSPNVRSDGFRINQSGTYSIADDCSGTMTVNIPGRTQLGLALAVGDFGQHVFAVISSEHVPFLPPAALPAGTSCSSGCNLGANVSVEMTQNLVRRR